MRNYKLRQGKGKKKAVLLPDQIEIYIPALLLCFLLAILIWMFIVGSTRDAEGAVTEETTAPMSETTQPVESDTRAEPLTDVDEPRPSDV